MVLRGTGALHERADHNIPLPDRSFPCADVPQVVNRARFAADFTNAEILEVLRDVSYYIAARGIRARE